MVPALVNSMEKKESRRVQPVTLTQLLGNMVSTGRHVWMTAEGQGTAGRKEKPQPTAAHVYKAGQRRERGSVGRRPAGCQEAEAASLEGMGTENH